MKAVGDAVISTTEAVASFTAGVALMRMRVCLIPFMRGKGVQCRKLTEELGPGVGRNEPYEFPKGERRKSACGQA